MTQIDVPYWLARPATEEPAAGVVVIHEGNGMSQQLLRFCERLAGEGYLVAAPDLFFRTGGPGAHEDFSVQFGAVRMDEVLDDLAKAAGVLRREGATKLGVTGFCMGGGFTWHAARHSDLFSAAAGFYGGGIASDLGEPNCPTVLFFGGDDAYISREDIDKVASAHPDTVVYEGAGHGFMRDGSDSYAPDAAADAWGRLLSHFGRHLR